MITLFPKNKEKILLNYSVRANILKTKSDKDNIRRQTRDQNFMTIDPKILKIHTRKLHH